MKSRNVVLLAILVALVAAGVAEGIVDTRSPRVREVVVRVPGLARESTLLQVTDVHARPGGISASALRGALGRRRADAVVLTGDTLDERSENREPAYEYAAVLREVAPRVYYLRGNHDPVGLGDELAGRGVFPLRPGAPIPLGSNLASEAALVYAPSASSLAGARGAGRRLLVVASHTPPNAARLDAGRALGRSGTRLFIAGHTHGGQVRLPFVGAVASPTTWSGEDGGRGASTAITALPDLKGLLIDGMYERDGQRVFVSQGLGTTWFHARFLDRSEVVLYRFVPVS